MPDTATAPTMTAAQLRAAGTRLLGFYLGGGGAKVDAMADPSHFLTRHDNGFLLAPALNTAAGGPVAGTVDDKASLFLTNPDTAYGLSIGVMGSGASWLQAQRRDGNASLYSLLLNPLGGSVGVGVSPIVKFHAKSSGEIARFETTTARGSGNGYVGIADPTGRKGYVGYGGGNDDFQVANELSGALQFVTANQFRWAITAGGLFYPVSDNTYNLASASNRIKDSWFVNSPTVSCDVRFKVYRSDRQLRAAEHAAVLEIFDTFGFFHRTDGTSGRQHFGPAAQEVYSIWAKHGLCDPLIENDKGELVPPPGAVPPAFMCFDLIGEETAPVAEGWRPSALLGPDGQPVMVKCAEGEEATEQRPTGETIVTREAGHIFGVRIDQLHSIMLAALNAERKAQAAQIAELASRIDADAA